MNLHESENIYIDMNAYWFIFSFSSLGYKGEIYLFLYLWCLEHERNNTICGVGKQFEQRAFTEQKLDCFFCCL